jgi:hypothetical protein
MLIALEMFLQDKIEIIFREQTEISQYIPDLPHTWNSYFSSNIPLAEAIHVIWKDLVETKLLTTFVDCINDLGLTITIRGNVIGLSYIIKHNDEKRIFYESWLGGIPATETHFIEFEKTNGSPLPSTYRSFCQIHNGFLKNGNAGAGYLPISKLALHQRILPFYGDGSGNLQVYNFEEPIGIDDYLTYDWDHETNELSKPNTFWNFVEDQFSMAFQ